MDWRSRSACRDEDPELFFPIGTTGPAVEQTDAAKRICMRCDVREECLEFALATNQDAGSAASRARSARQGGCESAYIPR
jgi:WhiB family transcriptional regulator, redox-sensing transcriptional regulator